MKPQTQQLMRLIADEVPGRLIAALRDQPQTAPQLEKATGASQKTVAHALELFQAHGIVERQQDQPGTPGRPSHIWRLLADKDLAAFEQACDAFKALLLRKQLDDYAHLTDRSGPGRS